MPLFVNDAGVWRDTEVWLNDAGVWRRPQVWVNDNGTWRLVAGQLTITISPTSRSFSQRDISAYTFPAFTVTVAGGSPTSFTWGFTGPSGGSFIISTGQGTPTASPRVTSVAAGSTATATLFCDVVVNGQTTRVTAALSYTNQPPIGTQ